MHGIKLNWPTKNLNIPISSTLWVISLYFIYAFPSRSVRQLHATGRPRIPQLPAEHGGWHPAGGEEAGKAERTPQEQRYRRHHGGRDGEQDWANMGSRYLPRHPDQWDPLPQLWNSMCGSAPISIFYVPVSPRIRDLSWISLKKGLAFCKDAERC